MPSPVKFTGGCACGAVSYACSSDALAMVFCHCRDCQRAGGSGGSPTVVVPRAAFALVRGEPCIHERAAESGATASRAFCAACGSPLFAWSSARPEVLGIRAGSLDDPSAFRPQAHVWTEAAQPWDWLAPALPRFAKSRR